MQSISALITSAMNEAQVSCPVFSGKICRKPCKNRPALEGVELARQHGLPTPSNDILKDFAAPACDLRPGSQGNPQNN